MPWAMSHGPMRHEAWGKGHGPEATGHALWGAWPWASSIPARLLRDPQQEPQALGARLHKKTPQNPRLLLRHGPRAMVHAPWGAWPWASSITARLPRDPQQGPQAMGGRVSKKTPQNPRLLLRHWPRAMVRMAMALRHAPSTVSRECFTFPVSSSAAATNPSPLET